MMNTNIDELIKKYFEGDTTCEEEAQIRAFFLQKEIPSHLEVYKPMFLFMQQEIEKQKQTSPKLDCERKNLRIQNMIHRCVYIGGAIAASAAIFAGIYIKIYHDNKEKNCCYAVIDGHRVTDKKMVKEFADASFKEVSTSKTEILNELRGTD